MAGERYDGGGIGVSVAATRAADDDTLRTLVADRVEEMRLQGTTTVEIKSGYGLTVDDEARALRIAARVHRRDDLPRRARGAGRVRRRPGRVRRAGHRPDAGRGGPVRALDRCVLRAELGPRLRRRRGPADPAGRPGRRPRAAGARQPARTRARASGWPSNWARPASTTAPTWTAPTSTRWPAGDTVATLLPGVEFCTRSPYPDAAALLRRRRADRAGHRLQSRHLLLVVDALGDQPGRPRDGADAGRRRCTPRPPARPGRCAATTSAGWSSGRAPT